MKRTCPTAKTGSGEVRTRLTTRGRMMLRSFEIRSDLAMQDRAAVEVVLRLNDGRSRWCYFLTPQALTNVVTGSMALRRQSTTTPRT